MKQLIRSIKEILINLGFSMTFSESFPHHSVRKPLLSTQVSCINPTSSHFIRQIENIQKAPTFLEPAWNWTEPCNKNTQTVMQPLPLWMAKLTLNGPVCAGITMKNDPTNVPPAMIKSFQWLYNRCFLHNSNRSNVLWQQPERGHSDELE